MTDQPLSLRQILSPAAELTDIRETLFGLARAHRSVIPPPALTAAELTALAVRIKAVIEVLPPDLTDPAQARNPDLFATLLAVASAAGYVSERARELLSQAADDIEADPRNTCDECDQFIPAGEPSEVNARHRESCSLHPANSASTGSVV